MVSFSDYTVNFSAQAIGTTSSASTVTLTNIGSAALNVTGFNLVSSEFIQTNNCPPTLAVAASCTINVSFTPTSSGNHQGTLSLIDNAYDTPQEVQLTGNLPVPALSISPSPVADSGAVAIGVINPWQSISVYSVGTAPATITNISVTGDFSQTGNCIGVLPVSESCYVNVFFRPTAAGVRTGTLLITDDSSGSPQSIPLSGTGVAELAMSTAPIQFPNVLVGQSSSPVALTLSNFTPSAIGINQIALSSPAFTQTNTCGMSVAPQASCVVNITFTPPFGGPSFTNLSVVDTNGHSQSAQVLGSGIDFALSPIASNIAVKAGQTATFSISLSSQADFVGTVSLSCQGGPKGSTCTTTPASIPMTLSNSFFMPTVTVTTPPTVAAAPMRFPPVSYGNYFEFRLSLGLLGALTLLLWWMQRRTVEASATHRAAVIVLLIGVLLLAVSCGGGSSVSTGPPPPPTPTNYSITITGTSGSLTNATQVTLTVNP
jgi:Abnormal spindle-like microcephaly-assoc'd, ASPM-SPD-2-Hydin